MENEALPVTRRAALGLIGAAAGGIALGSAAPALAVQAAVQPAVELIDNGTTVILRNGVVSATLVKATAQTSALYLIGSTHGNQGFNVLSGSHGGGYTTFNYAVGATTYVKSVSDASYRVVSQTSDRVVVAMTVDNAANLPFVVETHVALERGAPGLHYYMIFRYPDRMPDGLNIGQLRYAFALGDPSFTYFVVDDERGVRQRPTVAETQHWTTMQDTTYVLPDGTTLWSKYQNISNLEGDSHVFLASNGKVGVGLVQASKEAFDGGPTKQELTVHDYYDGEILLWHPFTSHYGSPALIPDKGWEKVYGPFFLHVTESAAADPTANVRDMWGKAKQRAQQEQARWPYSWVPDPLYAARTRSTVSGRLRVDGLRSAADAWVLLSRPGEDWQYENEAYTYSARADSNGRFTVKGVRPGAYTLSAFVDGAIGEYRKEGVQVGAGKTHDLGTLHFEPVSHGKTLWQIGTPNRSAAEFHIYGGPNGFREHMTWLEYPYEFPNGVDFKVGVDDIRRKWNYFHPAYKTPGTNLQLAWRGTTPDRSLAGWKIRFDSGGYVTGTATLDIALAASVFGTLRVALNGVDLASFDPLPGPPGDNSSYRLACRGMYRLLAPIVFPASAIKAGENVLTLSPVRPPKAPTSDNWMEPIAGVMYDVIRLQVDKAR